MRTFLATISIAAFLTACSGPTSDADFSMPDATASSSGYDITRQYEKFAEVQMNPDVSFLTDKERQVVNKLIEASDYLSQIYLLQRGINYPQMRENLEENGTDIQKAMFDLHFGPCDTLEDDAHVFAGDTPCPAGAGFYPVDMTKEEFEQWIADHPEDKAAFTSGYTVIRRTDDGGLKAIPYHVEYAEYLRPAAELMREAAKITKNKSLRRFFSRGFESPIAVTYQVHGGGDNENGVQTIAFNLPNDERVREAKGAKKVILNNVLGAKYDRILSPIGERVLISEQANLTAKKWMGNNTLFHELSHSLGPGTITVAGQETTVNARLKDLSSGLEEGKADVMGAYNILYMMKRGELDIREREAFLATYFSGKFRSMRFGTGAAHAKGAAFQYNYFRETGAAEWLPKEKRFQLDFDKLEQAISDLTAKVVMIQGDGNYDKAKAFLDKYLPLDEAAETVLNNLDDIPYDIRPVYPEAI